MRNNVPSKVPTKYRRNTERNIKRTIERLAERCTERRSEQSTDGIPKELPNKAPMDYRTNEEYRTKYRTKYQTKCRTKYRTIYQIDYQNGPIVFRHAGGVDDHPHHFLSGAVDDPARLDAGVFVAVLVLQPGQQASTHKQQQRASITKPKVGSTCSRGRGKSSSRFFCCSNWSDGSN